MYLNINLILIYDIQCLSIEHPLFQCNIKVGVVKVKSSEGKMKPEFVSFWTVTLQWIFAYFDPVVHQFSENRETKTSKPFFYDSEFKLKHMFC